MAASRVCLASFLNILCHDTGPCSGSPQAGGGGVTPFSLQAECSGEFSEPLTAEWLQLCEAGLAAYIFDSMGNSERGSSHCTCQAVKVKLQGLPLWASG